MQRAYSLLCSPALLLEGQCTFAGNVESVSPVRYWSGLQAGAAIQRLGVSEDTQSQRDKAMQELACWLGKSVCKRGLQDCIPEDIIVYPTTWWAETHGGYRGFDGSYFAAPVSLEAICSHLAVKFDKQGRAGDWDNSTASGRCTLAA